MNYYNEWEPYLNRWLHLLRYEGHLPYGRVDNRSINDVQGEDLKSYTQCHFFTGI